MRRLVSRLVLQLSFHSGGGSFCVSGTGTEDLLNREVGGGDDGGGGGRGRWIGEDVVEEEEEQEEGGGSERFLVSGSVDVASSSTGALVWSLQRRFAAHAEHTLLYQVGRWGGGWVGREGEREGGGWVGRE